MKDYVIKNLDNPYAQVSVKLGEDIPLWVYVKKALQDIEILNILSLYKIDDGVTPFIHLINFRWDPHPSIDEIQDRRRETGNKIKTKSTKPSRIGILYFDIYLGARDKFDNLVKKVIPSKMYIPIEDKHGRYLLDDIKYTQYQLVDKLLYPAKNNGHVFKSLLPITIERIDATETSINGYICSGNIVNVQVFKQFELTLASFMHIPCVLSYLEVFPILQFCQRVSDDTDKFEYFKPEPEYDICIKAYRKALDKPEFKYVRNILIMACKMIRDYEVETYENLNNPDWWIWKLSEYPGTLDHRGACHQVYVGRMLDTVTALNLPIPECDKRNMCTFLRWILQTEFTNVDIFDFSNKRFRMNEAISTIVTAEISAKLKSLFKYGTLLKMDDAEPKMKMNAFQVIKNLYKTELVQSIDFANDLDYYENLKYTTNGPNSLGHNDKHKISLAHKQLSPSMMGKVDLYATSKDVGQTGMISPYANLHEMNHSDVNKYPSIKFELYKFINEEFPNARSVRFDAKDIVEFNLILDDLVTYSYINLNYKVPKECAVTTQEELEEKDLEKKRKAAKRNKY
jgi:hypothetical protein